MFDGEITLQDLERELAEYAEAVAQRTSMFTPEQDRLLLSARDFHQMTWPNIETFWKKQFDSGCENTLRKRYRALKAAE